MISDDKIVNINELLKEIQLNKASKGEGPLKAAYCNVNFNLAYSAIKYMQSKEIIPFGPFTRKGTNCCRFVQKSILAGFPKAKYRWKLKWLFPIIPMPLKIVNLLPNKIRIPEREKLDEYKSEPILGRGEIKTKLFTVPLELNYILGKRNFAFEIGYSLTFVSETKNTNIQIWNPNPTVTKESENFIVSYLPVGFRLKPNKSGFTLKFNLGPLINYSAPNIFEYDKIHFWGGIAIGYSFF